MAQNDSQKKTERRISHKKSVGNEELITTISVIVSLKK